MDDVVCYEVMLDEGLAYEVQIQGNQVIEIVVESISESQ